MKLVTRSIQVQTPDCIKPIYDVLKKELDWSSVVAKYATTADDGIVPLFPGKGIIYPFLSLKYIWNDNKMCDRLLAWGLLYVLLVIVLYNFK